jgi:SAM-dependent methyltransferase
MLQVLEVGSGLGFFLDVCEEFGMNAAGCDINPDAVRYANRAHTRVRLGTLDDFYASDTYDAVFAFNLIEHLLHPKSFFEEACRVLCPGGTLVLETPVRESLFHQVARLGSRVTRGRVNLYGLNPGGHIYKFSKKTLQLFAKGTSFQQLSSRNISSPFGEIWGKSSIATVNNRLLYRTALPFLWGLAQLTGTGNRIFIMLRKRLPSAASESN